MKELPTNHTKSASITLQNGYSADVNKDLSAFFAVGMVINLVMLAAFFVWAYKQWRKK